MSGNNEVAIKVEGISKTFKLPHEKNTSIKGALVNIGKRKKGYEKQRVLKDISFEIKKGEFFGIVGRNGSGKSTLLKLLAGIYTPDKGNITVNGSLTPFIELGVGFNPDLTGRENVFLNGALLGFSRKQMEEMYEDIVEFAEIRRFMDQKLKNYSSGMQVRLAFSIAIRANTKILILDEVLAVGDEAFQKKCNDYFESIKEKGVTVVLVTHDMESVKRYCDRAILIEKGDIKVDGAPEEVASQYTLDNITAAKETKSGEVQLQPEIKHLSIRAISPLSVESSEGFEFEVIYELKHDIPINLGISVINQGVSLIEHNTKGIELGHKSNKRYKVRYKLPLNQFNAKQMRVDVAVFREKGFELIGFNTNACNFNIETKGKPIRRALLKQQGQWIV